MTQSLEEIKNTFPYQFSDRTQLWPSPGWHGLFAKLCRRVDVILPIYAKPYFHWDQVKSKFGGLRAYYHFSIPDNALLDERGYADISHALSDVTSSFEEMSYFLCEKCGVCGLPRNLDGWHVALCDACYLERTTSDD